MSDLAFAELESQVESLPLNQIVILKEKIDAMLARSQNVRVHEKEFVFDSLVRHTDRAVQLISSAVTVEEYCVYPLSHGDEKAVAAFDTFISGMKISIVPADKQIALEAARLRAKYKGFKALDAIHLATTKLSGCTSFITNDKRLTQMQEMRVITMDELNNV